MKKVTIVVPVFNAEKYLEKCIESLLKQTSNAFEILLINDGSTDGSDEIIKHYVSENKEIVHGIKKKNGGYGSVLDVAMKEIKTPYFMICRGEDTLEPSAIETMLSLAEISHADIVLGAKMVRSIDSAIKEYDCGYDRAKTKLAVNTVYNQDTEDFNDLFFVTPSGHGKLYQTDVAQGIGFPEHVKEVDSLLFYTSLLKAKKVIFTDKPISCELVNPVGHEEDAVRFSSVNGRILLYKSILNQAERISGIKIPDMFYYQMFEAFKMLLDASGKMECTVEQYEETLDYLKTYAVKLTDYTDQIKPLYRKYSEASLFEKIKDERLMSPKSFDFTYSLMQKQLVKAFKPQI